MQNIDDLTYRTKTYLAGDWSGDKNAIEKIYQWNTSDKYNLHFNDVHQYTQSYDTSDYCSIKKSLKKRMDISKRFILVVGDKTETLTKGACFNCYDYKTFLTNPAKCNRGYPIDNDSYIKYECKLAAKAYDEGKMEILVLYKSDMVDKSKCPAPVRNKGTHIPMWYKKSDNKRYRLHICFAETKPISFLQNSTSLGLAFNIG